MRFLAIEQELRPIDPSQHGALLRDEAACVWALRKSDVIRDIWFTHPERRAVVMLECESEDEAQQRLAALPLARAGFIAFEILALRSYDGFDRLIDQRTHEPGPASGPTRAPRTR